MLVKHAGIEFFILITCITIYNIIYIRGRMGECKEIEKKLEKFRKTLANT